MVFFFFTFQFSINFSLFNKDLRNQKMPMFLKLGSENNYLIYLKSFSNDKKNALVDEMLIID